MNKCIKCQKLTENPKFCSKSCSISYSNINRVKSRRRFCIICNNKLKKNAKNCCSYECYQKYRWQKAKNKIEQTGYFYPNTKFNTCAPNLKKYLKEKYGNKCSICGLNKWQDKPISLISDHINGIANDWSINNLRLVCPNCDSQLPTFKSKNKNGVRKYRNKRGQ
jgi:hypothetical protein